MESSFDVTIGSSGDSEVCDLVGTFILSKLGNNNKNNKDLDDGFVVLRRITA